MGVQEIRENGFGLAGAPARARNPRRPRPVSATGYDEPEPVPRKIQRSGFGSGVRLRVHPGLVPESTRGRVIGGIALVCLAGAIATVAEAGRRALLRDDRFLIPASSSIQIQGNSHLSRAQLLGVFGSDVERNVLTVPLTERRSELERLPWVEHATVMRLLPNKLRVAVVERTPIAFVRQGRHIGLVDSHGVLLDMADDDSPATTHYSFPVVTGINAEDPLSVRAARIKIFERFANDLDSSGERIAGKLSEVDLSNPEDVKALIPDQGSDLLVHFGDTDFLGRYRKFEEQLPGWRQQYPKLASADMRYERQVVLEMQPGTPTPVEIKAAIPQTAEPKKPATPLKSATAKKIASAPAAARPLKHGLSSKAISEIGKPHYPAEASKE